MRVIYKYQLTPNVDMPVGAEVLSVAVQGTGPVVWARVDPSQNLMEVRKFALVETGEQHEPAGTFVGTVVIGAPPDVAAFLPNGYVLHVFDLDA